MNLKFLWIKIFICFSIYCSDDNNLSNYIHIDYIKKSYPGIDAYQLRKNAVRDGYTAPCMIRIDKEFSLYLLGATLSIGLIGFLAKNNDKIESWIKALIIPYPDIKIDSSSGGVTFGVPYYVFIPFIALTYLVAKK